LEREPKAERKGRSVRQHARSIGEGVAGRNVPLRFSLACQSFSFLFRGVQRGDFSFQRERSEIMKGDELLTQPKGFTGEEPTSGCQSRLNE
jgi:hypothetical protein